MNLVLKGSTDVTRYVMLVDSAAGTPETSYTITNLDLQYTRNRSAPAAKVDATALAAADSAHGDNKAIEIDATSSPGLYRVDWPDAAFATGVDKVILVVSGSGLHPAVEEIQLVNFNPEDGVRLGLTALPNAAADAAGGLIISDAGGLDADAQLVTKINDILTDTGTTLQAEVDGIQADTEDIQTRLPAALVSGRIDASVGAIAANAITAASMAADASAEIADAVWDEDATGHQTGGTFGQAIGDPGASTETLFKAIVTDPAGTNIAADVIAIKAETAAILDDTDDIGVAGAGLTAIDLPDQTMNITGNITGNLSGSVGSVTGAVGSVTGLTASDVGAIKAKTDNLPTDPADQSLIIAATDAIAAAIAALNNLSAAQVNAEVVDALVTDTYAESAAVVGATASLKDSLVWLRTLARNKIIQTATTQALRNDADSGDIATAAVSDDGVTATRAEWA